MGGREARRTGGGAALLQGMSRKSVVDKLSADPVFARHHVEMRGHLVDQYAAADAEGRPRRFNRSSVSVVQTTGCVQELKAVGRTLLFTAEAYKTKFGRSHIEDRIFQQPHTVYFVATSTLKALCASVCRPQDGLELELVERPGAPGPIECVRVWQPEPDMPPDGVWELTRKDTVSTEMVNMVDDGTETIHKSQQQRTFKRMLEAQEETPRDLPSELALANPQPQGPESSDSDESVRGFTRPVRKAPRKHHTAPQGSGGLTTSERSSRSTARPPPANRASSSSSNGPGVARKHSVAPEPKVAKVTKSAMAMTALIGDVKAEYAAVLKDLGISTSSEEASESTVTAWTVDLNFLSTSVKDRSLSVSQCYMIHVIHDSDSQWLACF